VRSNAPTAPAEILVVRVDESFYRARYNTARTIDTFADRLRDEVNLDALREDLLVSVQQTMAPAI